MEAGKISRPAGQPVSVSDSGKPAPTAGHHRIQPPGAFRAARQHQRLVSGRCRRHFDCGGIGRYCCVSRSRSSGQSHVSQLRAKSLYTQIRQTRILESNEKTAKNAKSAKNCRSKTSCNSCHSWLFSGHSINKFTIISYNSEKTPAGFVLPAFFRWRGKMIYDLRLMTCPEQRRRIDDFAYGSIVAESGRERLMRRPRGYLFALRQ